MYHLQRLALTLLLLGFAATAALGAPAYAQVGHDELTPPAVTPQPATPDDELTLSGRLSTGGKLSCDLHFPIETSLTRTGNTFQYNYAIRARGPGSPMYPCVLVPLPLPFEVSLGNLPVGSYEVKVVGTTLGQPNPDQTVTFTVSGSPAGIGGTGPSPEVIPSEPNSADSVKLLITDGAAYNGCNLDMPEPVSVVRNGRSISINYAYRSIDESEAPPGTLCISAFVPAYFWVELGQLPPGAYDITVNGSFDGVARAQQQGSFAVRGGPGAAFIPVGAPWALSLMLLALGSVAAWRLRVR